MAKVGRKKIKDAVIFKVTITAKYTNQLKEFVKSLQEFETKK